MKVKHYKFEKIEDLKDFNPKIDNPEKCLIQVFSGFVTLDEVKKIQEILNNKNLKYIGTTTGGEIYLGRAYFHSLVISVVEFEDSEVEYGFFENRGDDTAFGKEIATNMYKNDPKLAILFLSGLLVNQEDILTAMAQVNNKVIVAGGLAGDNGAIKETFTFTHEGISNNGAAIAAIKGERLYIINDYKLNWQPFGKKMVVTKANKNHLFEIDNTPAKEIYRRYLGDRIADSLPHSSTEFPLVKLTGDMLVCRVVVHVFDDGSFLMIGNLEEGDIVKFAIGNVDLIVNKTKEEIYEEFNLKPEVIFNYSCAGRLAFLQEEVNIELAPFNDIAPSAGFFTYGEILYKNGKNYILNESLTFIGIAEHPKKFEKKYIPQKKVTNFLQENKQLIIMEVLLNITSRVIEELDESKQQVEELLNKIRQSIEFAALLQNTILPDPKEIEEFFEDVFVMWEPKDIVGGDIYFFELLNDENEAILMVIDCTGHGVPGAFVTMIVKAIEREIIQLIEEAKLKDVSPAWMLKYFNQTIKKLLKQEKNRYASIANAGFDGGILYYDKKNQIIKYSGAQTPLFYVENGEVKIIKGDRHSVGYKDSDYYYEFKEHTLNVKEGMVFYLTTDGYLDQNGGEKGFPFGKRRFMDLIKKTYHLPMKKQYTIFKEALNDYQGEYERNDDITLIGFKVGKRSDRELILEYEGILTQSIIAYNVEILEKKIKNLTLLAKVITVFIEMTQNMMHYSKATKKEKTTLYTEGKIKVIRDGENIIIISKNVIDKNDFEKLKNRLDEIKRLDKKEIKKRYKELRKNEAHKHEKGGGIGFYEIAKLGEIDYEFEQIAKDKYFFNLKVTIS